MIEVQFIDPSSDLGRSLFGDSDFGAALAAAFGDEKSKCGCLRCHLRRRLENEGHTLTLDDAEVINAVINSYPGLADTLNQMIRADIPKGQAMVNMVRDSGYPAMAKAMGIMMESYAKVQDMKDELRAEKTKKEAEANFCAGSAESGEAQPMAEKPPEDPLPQQAPIA
jgi:hypothetical protein